MNIIGIDPGLSGAIVHLSEHGFDKSLDALKALQDDHLQGWVFSCFNEGQVRLYLSSDIFIDIEYLPTMNLAWMDAIYQTIEWKRKQNDE